MNTVSLCLENVGTLLCCKLYLSASGPAYLKSAVRRESRRKARASLPGCEIPFASASQAAAQLRGSPVAPTHPGAAPGRPCPHVRRAMHNLQAQALCSPPFCPSLSLTLSLADARPGPGRPPACLHVCSARCRVKIRLPTRPGLLQLPGSRSPLLIG